MGSAESIRRENVKRVVSSGARGCSLVYWITHETNAVAQSLYNKLAERSGFIQFVQKLA